MFKGQLSLKFVITPVDGLARHTSVGKLTIAFKVLSAAVEEARTARKECNQARSELESARQSRNPTLPYLQQRQQTYFSAAVRVKAAPQPLYDALRDMQEVVRSLAAELRKPDDVSNYDQWSDRQLLRNNFACAVELMKEAVDLYENMPQPPMEGYLCDHVFNVSYGACDTVASWPQLPVRYRDGSQDVADFLAACLAATTAESADGSWEVCVLKTTGEVVEKVSALLRAEGWSVRKASRKQAIVLRRA